MNLSLTLLLLLTLSLPPLLHSASNSELRSLLEFKKGIQLDPHGVVSSWDTAAVATLDANDCPSAWRGVSCEGGDGADSGNVTAIVLEGLALAGELKFHALTELKALRNLSLAGNNFTGRVEPVLGTITTLQYLDLSSNSFYGPIPARINDLWGLNYLNFSQNNFSSGFPSGIQNLQQLKTLDMHGNGLWGDIAELLLELKNVEYVDLSFNEFFGSISTNSSVITSLANTVRHLDLSHNNLSGGFLASDSVQLFRNLEVLDLGDNQITGELPSLSSMPRLRILRLGRNQFSGSIQEELLESSVALEELDLSGNRFTGSLLGINSTSLNFLNLSTNMISGDISIMQNWSSELQVLDLSSNKLSGTLPSGNNFSGPIPLQGSHASELLVQTTNLRIEYLDLSANYFTGVLPSDIGNIPSLRLLNLARNNFSGQLPIELSKLTSLEYLDLSVNKFMGNIPDNLPSSLKVFNVSDNDLSGNIPENLKHFPQSSFAGNKDLNLGKGVPDHLSGQKKHEKSKGNIRLAIILASVGAAVMIVFVLVAYHKAHIKEFHGRSGFNDQNTGRDVKLGRFTRPSLFNFHRNVEPRPTSMSFSNDHLLTSNPRSLPGQTEFLTETVEHVLPEGVSATSATVNSNVLDHNPATSGRRSSPGSPLSSSPRFIEGSEQPVMLDVYSPDRFAGELFFLDTSLAFTAEDLSRAPAEVLGRSSHGTLYKATLDNGHMLTVKWLRVGLVKHKKELAREVKRIGSIRHPHIVPLRAYYWGPREQERLLLADYVRGDSLALHLYETTPRRYSPLSFSQRLKVATEIANCLLYLHDRGLPHGNLKPTNILLEGPDYTARLTDYGLHRLMTAAGIAEQILNLGALGYCAPELATAVKPVPSFKADVYALGVILMELLTRRSAGDIISGQSGAVDLTDWVRLCDQEGRRMDCIDRDIAGGEEPSNAMDELLGVSLRCILPVNERPNIRQIFDELCSISI
ncbi:probable inactive receptor kinase At5g10020 isoform X2 [Quercus robur]|uniref:probable inactive receptor kinase At5g10020 isoform X2 n=1 Tax=Quercus robur TaxID=38942 RepID=UPI0021637731|nr:probable inactive receptor kinase At5g10020 isoform X2 [Quercus robur]